MLHLVDSQPNANVGGRHERCGAVDEPEATVAPHQRNERERVKETVGHTANQIALRIRALLKIEARATLLGVVDDGARQECYILYCALDFRDKVT